MERLDLGGVWELERMNGDRTPAKVPGSVLSCLLEAGKIPDPFDRENEYAVNALFEEDFVFERRFTVTEETAAFRHKELVFEGIDTVAEVSLNGVTVLKADNMHRTWRVEAGQALKVGENILRVFLRAPYQVIREGFEKNPDITYDGSDKVHGTSSVRKAHYMFGWDWGPQLADCGIWRDCYLECRNEARISDVEILQGHNTDSVEVTVRVEMDREDASGTLTAEMTSPVGEIIPGSREGNTFRFVVKNPALWMPNGWGDHPLYGVDVTYCPPAGEKPQVIRKRIGLRTLELSRDKDQWGEEFCFRINGNKLFAMGADYIPEDNIISRVTEERTRRLLEDCAKANYNCVRVWGGGYYPDDRFFDICDELGLVVWMDLMFACNIYKMTEAFTENITAEARDNLRRIRHHACMGLVCGNNEMETAWISWGGVMNHSAELKRDYVKQFEHVLKDVSETEAKQVPYWPSSPSSGGGFDDPNGFDRGDVHDWSVWHGMEPFESYQAKYPRFCSEFGFESFPSMKTIRSFTLPADRNIFSRVMENHQKCVGGNGKIMHYISRNYPYPGTLEQIVYASQLLQAEAIRYGVEHWRRYRGRCMGAIYWQVNDCWPVASWASIDSFGRWKGLHYAAKRFFAPLLISCRREGFRVEVAVTNDSLKAFEGTAEWRLIDAAGREVMNGRQDVQADALSVCRVMTEDFTSYCDMDQLHPEDHYALIMTLRDRTGKEISRNCELFSMAKHFAFERAEIRTEIRQVGADCEITLDTDTFVWNLCLETENTDCRFSDNWFFLLPGEPRTVTVENIGAEELKKELRLTHVGMLTAAGD